MRIEAVELRQLRIPMTEPMVAAHGIIHDRLTILVRVFSDIGDGWGECVAWNEATYRPEWSDGEYEYLRDVLLPSPLEGRAHGKADEHLTSKAALELALLDATLRANNVSLAQHLGAQVDRVPVIGIVPLLDGDELLRSVERLVKLGFNALKLKVVPGRDSDRVALVNKHFPKLVTRVDANGSYVWDDIQHQSALHSLDDLGLEMIEQPFGVDQWSALEVARKSLSTPIALDESVDSLETALRVVQEGLCDALIVKPGTIGGLQATRHLMTSDASVVIGGMVETAVGRAGNLALAACDPTPKAAELAPDGRWFQRSVVRESTVLRDGFVDVPKGSGTGVTIDPAIVRDLTVRSVVVR